MNVIVLTGRLCETPELRQTATGKSVMTSNIAVDRPFSKGVTDFFTVVFWNSQAEFLSNYARKGSKIAVTGKLTSRGYEDKQGNKRTAYEVLVDTVELLDKKEQAEGYTPTPAPVAASDPMEAPNFMELADDDNLPF